MASDQSGEGADGAMATSRAISELVAFSTVIVPAPANGCDTPSTKPSRSIGSAQGLDTTPTAPSSPPPHLSTPHSVVTASLLNADPPRPPSGSESDHEDPCYPPSRLPAQHAGALRRPVQGKSQPSTLVLDHSYTSRESSTTSNDATANQTTASAGCSIEGGGNGGKPSPIRRRGRPSKVAAGTVEGNYRDLSSPSSIPSPGKRFGPSNAIKFKCRRGRGRGCGLCLSCAKEDCGVCRFCRDKPKFGGAGKQKQRCAERVCTKAIVGQVGVHMCTPPMERYEDLESSTPRKSVAEILHFYDEDEARTLSVFPAEATLLQPQHEPHPQQEPRPQYEPHLPTQSVRILSSDKATSGETKKAFLSIIKHSVIIKASQITRPCVVETPLETNNPSKPSDMENGVTSKMQQSEMNAHTEVRAPVETPCEELMDDTSKDTSVFISEDKTDSLSQTRSQVERERSKSVLSQAAEKDTMSAKRTKEGRRRALSLFGDFDMKCLVCGRQRKLSVARSDKFCSRRCIQQWSEAHPGEEPEGSEEAQVSSVSSVTRPKMPTNSRELKNLQINMALPGKGSPPPILHYRSPSRNPLSPVLGPSPRPLSSPVVSICKVTPPAKSTDGGDTGHTNSGTKRASVSQPEPKKKPREDHYHHGDTTSATTKEANMCDFTYPTTTMVLPISARTVPPPPVSIMHMNQIPSLVSALSNLTEPRSYSRGLSSNIRNWSIEQVVQYFESIQDCWDYLEIFREHELDGSSLLLLTHESLVKCLGIKLGHALKIMHHVEELRRFYDTSL